MSKARSKTQAQPQENSRNILNGGKQLSLMSVCSDIMDHSADLDLDFLKEDSNDSQKEEEDEYLTFQLCQGEEMNTATVNFIGIHMLNDGQYDEDESKDPNGGQTFQCPETGSHFEFNDLVDRMARLKDKRDMIDESIRKED